MTVSQAGARRTKGRATSVVNDTKIDALASQLADLRVLLAQVAGDTRAILARLDAIDRSVADHEQRIRDLESIGADEHGAEISKLREQLEALREWRSWVLGLAAGVGAIAGGGIAAIAKTLG